MPSMIGAPADPAAVTFSLADLVREVVAPLREFANHRSVGIETAIDAELPERLAGHPECLRHVLTMLASHALRTTTCGSVVLVVCADGTDEQPLVRFEVADTGPGTQPAVVAAIWSLVPRDGLAAEPHVIAANLIKILGGKLRVSSEPSRGSRFWFTLPLKATISQTFRVPAEELR